MAKASGASPEESPASMIVRRRARTDVTPSNGKTHLASDASDPRTGSGNRLVPLGEGLGPNGSGRLWRGNSTAGARPRRSRRRRDSHAAIDEYRRRGKGPPAAPNP